MAAAPGRSAERRDPGLQKSLEEDGRVLSGDDEVENGQRSDGVHQQPGDDGDHVETELLGGARQVLDAEELAGDQTHDAERRVPANRQQPSTV